MHKANIHLRSSFKPDVTAWLIRRAQWKALMFFDADESATNWHDKLLRECTITRDVMRVTMNSYVPFGCHSGALRSAGSIGLRIKDVMEMVSSRIV